MSDDGAAPWRLALVLGDDDAVRVLAAWYAVPPRQRDGKPGRVARLAGIDGSVAAILVRLDAAGLLDRKAIDPPPVAMRLIATFVAGKLSKKAR